MDQPHIVRFLSSPCQMLIGTANGRRLDLVGDVGVKLSAPDRSDGRVAFKGVTVQVRGGALARINELLLRTNRFYSPLSIVFVSRRWKAVCIHFSNSHVSMWGKLKTRRGDDVVNVVFYSTRSFVYEYDDKFRMRKLKLCAISVHGGPLEGGVEVVRFPANRTLWLNGGDPNRPFMRHERVPFNGGWRYEYAPLPELGDDGKLYLMPEWFRSLIKEHGNEKTC